MLNLKVEELVSITDSIYGSALEIGLIRSGVGEVHSAYYGQDEFGNYRFYLVYDEVSEMLKLVSWLDIDEFEKQLVIADRGRSFIEVRMNQYGNLTQTPMQVVETDSMLGIGVRLKDRDHYVTVVITKHHVTVRSYKDK